MRKGQDERSPRGVFEGSPTDLCLHVLCALVLLFNGSGREDTAPPIFPLKFFRLRLSHGRATTSLGRRRGGSLGFCVCNSLMGDFHQGRQPRGPGPGAQWGRHRIPDPLSSCGNVLRISRLIEFLAPCNRIFYWVFQSFQSIGI